MFWSNKMKNVIRLLILMFITLNTSIAAAADNGTFTLTEVIESDARIKDHKPSIFIADMTGEFVKVKDNWYQVRLFFFETDPPSTPLDNVSFEEFITQNKLGTSEPKSSAESIIETIYFNAPSNIRDSGTNYMISLRKVTDAKKIDELNAQMKPAAPPSEPTPMTEVMPQPSSMDASNN